MTFQFFYSFHLELIFIVFLSYIDYKLSIIELFYINLFFYIHSYYKSYFNLSVNFLYYLINHFNNLYLSILILFLFNFLFIFFKYSFSYSKKLFYHSNI